MYGFVGEADSTVVAGFALAFVSSVCLVACSSGSGSLGPSEESTPAPGAAADDSSGDGHASEGSSDASESSGGGASRQPEPASGDSPTTSSDAGETEAVPSSDPTEEGPPSETEPPLGDGGASSSPVMTPLPLCPGAQGSGSATTCDDETPCEFAAYCDPNATSNAPVGCGACPPPQCTSDDDCSGTMICEPGRCNCGDSVCVPGCDDESCPEGFRCEDSGRCAVWMCEDGGPCPEDWHCNPSGAETNVRGCERTSCEDGTPCWETERCDSASALANAFGCAPVHCSEIPCDDGYECMMDQEGRGCRRITCAEPGGRECAANYECDPVDGVCRNRACVANADCDCGACLAGLCAPRPGVCVPFAL